MGLKTNIYSFVRAEMKEEGDQEQTRIYLNEISTRIVWNLLQELIFSVPFKCE